jgi:hypothetical protein
MRRVIEAMLILLLVPGFNFAQSPQRNWDNLKQLAPGQPIWIVLNDAKSYKAEFQGVSSDAIVVRLATGDQAFERQSVLRISTQGKSQRGRNALIGLAVGTGAGIIVGVASPELGQGKCSQGSCIDVGQVSALGVAGAAAGAVLGAVIPTGGWHDVYRAR